jgi:preprotein translocase subunit SecG
MYQVIIVIHILLGLSIIGLILMQQGKGADAGAGFGGGASGSVFGAQGAASFLSRTTAIMATLFFITSLGLAWLNGNKSGVAADFMNSPAVEKEAPDLGLPNVDGANGKEAVPATLPESKTEVVTPPPAAAPAQPVDAPKPVETAPATTTPETTSTPVAERAETPKAEEAKVVEEQKPEPKPEKPAKTHKSAKAHHKKN